MKQIKNALEEPKLFYALHMCAGVAEYPEMEGSPRILIEEETLRKMDPTAQGKPIYVHHVEKVDLANLQEEMAGVWVRSFFNEADGKHWAEIMVISDEGHQAVRNGWKVSNAYQPTSEGPGGMWHGVEYQAEIMDGEFTHLALTPTPRYQESVIFSPEEFKKYNERLTEQRLALQNSSIKGERKMKLNFFKREAVKNAEDLSGMEVTLPKSNKTISLERLVNEADDRITREEKGEEMANVMHKVKLHDGSMCNVGELIEKFKTSAEENSTLRANYDELAKELHPTDAPEEDKLNEETPEEKKAREEKEKKNADEKKAAEEKKNSTHAAAIAAAKALKNAGPSTATTMGEEGGPQVVKTLGDKVEMGKARYGSAPKQ